MPCSVDIRRDALETAGFNTALVSSDFVPVDLSTDLPDEMPSRGSVTAQHAHDELGRAIKEVFGLDFWMTVHLGRGAEAAIASTLRPGECVLANEVYVTGAWSIQRFGGRIIEVDHDGDPVFRGNLDAGHVDALLEEGAAAFVHVTLPRTLLSRRGGAPVSLANLRALRRVLDRRSSLLVLDASRVFENAAWIRRYEPGQGVRNLCDIVHDLAACADLLFLSGRKDAGASHGGVIAAREASHLYRLRDATLLLEGDSPWGGIGPTTAWELAVGIREAAAGRGPVARIEALEALARHLVEHVVPVVSCGAGAIYLDAARALPEVPREECPAQTLLILMYLAAGIRGLGTPAQFQGEDQIVRLSLRTAAKDYLAKVLPLILREGKSISAGVRISAEGGPFLAKHEPVDLNAWRTRTPLPDPPILPPSDMGFGNAAWPRLERSLRRRLHAPESWRLLPAARERGPQSMLAETATRQWPALTLHTSDGLVERLVAFWSQRSPPGPIGEPHRLSVVPVSRLAGLEQKAAGLVAVDLGPLGTWPARPADLQGADLLWACDPAGPRAPGGFLAFREDSLLYRSVRDGMLFFAGSLHDGGLSAADMAGLATALDL